MYNIDDLSKLIGLKFKLRDGKTVTVYDIEITESFGSGKVVKQVFKAFHKTLGQKVKRDLPIASIIRAERVK